MRVLLVDDEEELVSTMAERLALRGIEADWATTGKAALEEVGKNKYDLALLDVRIPGQSGIELKKALAAKQPEMKFIFMTGHGSEEDYRAGTAEAGEEYYLVKPINIDDLIRRMKLAMEDK
ncbi:MAG: response regulator [Desulfobacteraceae bacterium]